MELKDIVSISGMSGLFAVVAKRTDGMVVRGLDDEKPQFISSRVHAFTPLDAITIYTGEKDSTELYKVLLEMKKQEQENPIADPNGSNDSLKAYFKKVLPDYNEERVYVSDIKKLIKWYQALGKHNLLTDEVLVPKKEESKDDEHKKVPEKKEAAEKAHKPAAQPRAKEHSMTHSKAAAKRTSIGSKKG